MEKYLSSMQAMYANAVEQNGEIYDIAEQLTANFRNITSDAILEDSRIIKILRYAIAPSISQMKFGQLFGLRSIDTFEKERISAESSKYGRLKQITDEMAEFTAAHIDKSRFIWLDPLEVATDGDLARQFAKRWTCSIMSDQNAQTIYRNWRKDQQEHAITSELVSLGYTSSSFSEIVQKSSDIKIGEFTRELRVQGRTRQKADVIVRSKKSHKLLLIEAKAVGVEIDSTKRIKECCDKANDWSSSDALAKPRIVAVIAGFFNTTGIETLLASNIDVIWEHRLSDLQELL